MTNGRRRRARWPIVIGGSVLAVLLAIAAVAPGDELRIGTPRVPTDDGEVLELLPLLGSNPEARELQALRAELRSNPRDARAAVRAATLYLELARRTADPRHLGHAQAAL